MKNHIMLLLMTAALIVFEFSMVSSQEEMMVVDNSVFDNPQRPSSVFRHDEHNEAAGIENCNECHHVYEDGRKLEDESSEDQRCSDCHGSESDGGIPSLEKAFHRNCKGCHMEVRKGPVLCGRCHLNE